MRLKNVSKILVTLLIVLFSAEAVLASFGISPPFVKNYHLLPGSHAEHTIVFSRADPQKVRVEITIDAPEIGEWLSIDKGLSFILPAGEEQVPMVVSVDVPKNAPVGEYKGEITAVAYPLDSAESGEGVTFIQGALIRIDLAVTGEEFPDFKVRLINIPVLEEGSPVKVSLEIENTGNVATAPSKVNLKVYDKYYSELLWSGDDTDLELTEAFGIKEISASFPIELGIDYYWGEVEVFKGEENVKSRRIYFEVVEKGTLGLTEEEGQWYQNLLSKLPPLYTGAGIMFLVVLGLLIWAERKRKNISLKDPKKKKRNEGNKKREEKSE